MMQQPSADIPALQHTRDDIPACFALEMYQPQPNVLYSLDAAAHLAAVPRRTLLVYCRAHLVQPVLLPPFGMMAFTEEAIYIVRRMEQLRAIHRCDLAWLNTVCDLLNEVEWLRAEVRFLRSA